MHELQFRIPFVDLTHINTEYLVEKVPVAIADTAEIYKLSDVRSTIRELVYCYQNHYTAIGRLLIRASVWEDGYIEISINRSKREPSFVTTISGFLTEGSVVEDVVERIVQQIIFSSLVSVGRSLKPAQLKKAAKQLLLDLPVLPSVEM
jgi:hypothetical protein